MKSKVFGWMVPLAGLEPARCRQQQILSLPRLPFRHRGIHRREAIAGRIILAARAGSIKVPLIGVGGRDEVRVFLRAALEGKEIVIAAARGARIEPANGGPRLVDRALALLGIEEPADAAEMGIGLAAHEIFVAPLHCGELLARLGEAEAEMLGQALHVTLVELDQGIGTAISRALQTIVLSHANNALNSRRRDLDTAPSPAASVQSPLWERMRQRLANSSAPSIGRL